MRQEARSNKDYAQADASRNKLSEIELFWIRLKAYVGKTVKFEQYQQIKLMLWAACTVAGLTYGERNNLIRYFWHISVMLFFSL